MNKRIFSADDGSHKFGEVLRSSVAPQRHEGQHESARYTHPAFGLVTVTQWHGGGPAENTRMFGSDIGHNSGITLHFESAELVRDALSEDKIYGHGKLLEVTMSLSQWSRFVSSIGNGGGIPVTIRKKRGGDLIPCPQIAAPEASKREVHGEEMAEALKERLAAMRAQVDKLGAMIADGKITKTTLKEAHSELRRHCEQLPGSVQFVYDQFARATEHVVNDAKTEFEVHVDAVASRLGYKQIRDMAPLLSGAAEAAKE
jgi:hypothetical protein